MHVSFQQDKKRWMEIVYKYCVYPRGAWPPFFWPAWWLWRVSPPIFDRYTNGLESSSNRKHQLTVVLWKRWGGWHDFRWFYGFLFSKSWGKPGWDNVVTANLSRTGGSLWMMIIPYLPKMVVNWLNPPNLNHWKLIDMLKPKNHPVKINKFNFHPPPWLWPGWVVAFQFDQGLHQNIGNFLSWKQPWSFFPGTQMGPVILIGVWAFFLDGFLAPKYRTFTGSRSSLIGTVRYINRVPESQSLDSTIRQTSPTKQIQSIHWVDLGDVIILIT